MRVLIVGAAGSLGRQLAREFSEHGHEVVCFDLKRVEGSSHRWVIGDVRVPHSVMEAAAGCQALAHLPAWHGIHLRHKSRRDFWELNVDGAFNTFQAAKTVGARKLLFCSTMGVYGGIPRPPDRALRITDDSPVLPGRDIYATTKVIGERLGELYHQADGLDVLAFRFGMFVPVDFFHYGMRLLHGGVDERDLAQAFRLALETEDVHSGAFNLFSPVPFEAQDEAQLVSDPLAVVRQYYPDAGVLETAARGRRLDPHWYTVADEGAITPNPIRVYYRSDRAQSVLGWQPQYDFFRFLQDLKEGTADYVRENRYPVPDAPAPWCP
jgi:UDP-glucose 4-epimerase